MTWVERTLGVLLVVSVSLAVVAQQRYLALLCKRKVLLRHYDKAEQQLSTMWNSKKP